MRIVPASSRRSARAEIEVLSDVPACACDEELNREITASIHELDDLIVLLPKYHVMGSEDFAFFTEQVPSSCHFHREKALLIVEKILRKVGKLLAFSRLFCYDNYL